MKDAKTDVLEQLLTKVRFIRRRGTAEQAAAAVTYEQQFTRDLENHRAEQAKAEQAEPQEVAA